MSDSWPTAAILSDWLRYSGTLPSGAVSDVHIELKHTTSISKLVFLTASYTHEAPAGLPPRLVVKSPSVKTSDNFSRTELQFYRQLGNVVGTPPVVLCLATVE